VACNTLFKGFIKIGKAVTFHDKLEATPLQFFEGFMYLFSYPSKDKPAGWRSAGAQQHQSVERCWSYSNYPCFEEVRRYLDNDDAGSYKVFEMRNY
jgi:hypothetical protein